PAPIALGDDLSNVGNGRRVCVVGDTEQTYAPIMRSLVADGWKVTLLDLAPADKAARPKDIDCEYVRLAGLYREANWYIPTQSLCAYQWLRDHSFDLVLFQAFGAALFSCVARRYGLAFKNVPFVMLVDEPYAYRLEKSENFPPFLRTDIEI